MPQLFTHPQSSSNTQTQPHLYSTLTGRDRERERGGKKNARRTKHGCHQTELWLHGTTANQGYLKGNSHPQKVSHTSAQDTGANVYFVFKYEAECKVLEGSRKEVTLILFLYIPLLQAGLQGQISKVGTWKRLPFS